MAEVQEDVQLEGEVSPNKEEPENKDDKKEEKKFDLAEDTE